jgi:carbonic anhydrase
MQMILKGLTKLRPEFSLEQNDLFVSLATGHYSQALFITCRHSRVALNLIRQEKHADLFISRHVGNIFVPNRSSGGPPIKVTHDSTRRSVRHTMSDIIQNEFAEGVESYA